MAQGRTPEKAPEGTFSLAVALEANPLGTGRSRISVWSLPNIRLGNNAELWPRLVELTMKTAVGREHWQIVIEHDETLSRRKGFVRLKDGTDYAVADPSIEDFLEKWEIAEINHHSNQRRRERRLIANQ